MSTTTMVTTEQQSFSDRTLYVWLKLLCYVTHQESYRVKKGSKHLGGKNGTKQLLHGPWADSSISSYMRKSEPFCDTSVVPDG